jgi:hypothetical protein
MGENVRALILALAVLALATPARAEKLDQLQTLTQDQFRLLSEDLGGAFSYRPMNPAAPLGVLGFDIGVGLTGAKLRNPAIYDQASSENAPETLAIPTLRAAVGLPLNFDIGVTYASVPSTDITFYGAELKWAFVPGDTTWPAIAVRGAMTRVSDLDNYGLDTQSIDLSISKGFAFFTPYGGFGSVWAKSDPKGTVGLREEKFQLGKVFAGVAMKFAIFNVNLEADQTGDVRAFSAKLGLRF